MQNLFVLNLDLAKIWPRLASNGKASCLSLLSAEIKDMNLWEFLKFIKLLFPPEFHTTSFFTSFKSNVTPSTKALPHHPS
jgi:hypothetical protein